MTPGNFGPEKVFDKNLPRCKWCNLKNPEYVAYHDNEWGKFSEKSAYDKYLFEMLTLESFQAGLSWECVLNKRNCFRSAYDGFDLEKVCGYGEEKIAERSGIFSQKTTRYAGMSQKLIAKKLSSEAIQSDCSSLLRCAREERKWQI